MPSKPHEREPLSDGVKKVLAIRDGSLPRYFAYRTTPNPEKDPTFLLSCVTRTSSSPAMRIAMGLASTRTWHWARKPTKWHCPGKPVAGRAGTGQSPESCGDLRGRLFRVLLAGGAKMKQCARTSGPWSRNHVNGAGPVVELQYHRLYRQWSIES